MSDQEELVLLLRRTNELLTVLAKAQLRSVFESEHANSKKMKLYELTGKSLTAKQISSKLNMSTATISGTWKHWETLGIIVKEGKKYRRIFDD